MGEINRLIIESDGNVKIVAEVAKKVAELLIIESDGNVKLMRTLNYDGGLSLIIESDGNVKYNRRYRKEKTFSTYNRIRLKCKDS